MKNRVVMLVIIIAIVLGGGFYAFKQLMPPETQEVQGPVYSTAEVVKGDISVGVETVGQLNPTQGGGIRVPEAGDPSMMSVQYIIDEYLVEEGQEVKQGEVVARLVSVDLQTKVEDLQDQIESQRKLLSQMTGIDIENVDNIDPSRGVNLVASISGKIVNLVIKEGDELTQGQIVARIVDDSKFKVAAKLTPTEYKKVKEGQKVKISFPYFDGLYDGVITDLNPNPVPNDDDEFGTTFVHWATIEGTNSGLIQLGMDVNIGLPDKNNQDSMLSTFMYTGEVDSFVKEEKVISQIEAVATEVHVHDMQTVKVGDPIITMSGPDVRDMIQEKYDKIRELNNELRILSTTLDQLEIKAPMDGVVAGTYRQPGETVRAGEWIGDIYNTSSMRMWTEVDDIDVLQVQQDAPVKVTVDALPGESFEGKVSRVSTMGKDMNGITRFSVEIEITGGPKLRPGMQAQAFIDAGSAEDVLLVPLEAIFEEDGVSKVEILNTDGTPKVVTVKLGLMNDRVAQIESGLSQGDLVVTGSTADLLPSQHIKSQDTLLPTNQDSNEDNNDNSGDNSNNEGSN